MSDQWLSEVQEQIQVLDMELQIGLKVLIHRADAKYVVAFMQVLARRDKLTASVISYLAKKQSLKPQVPEAKPVPREDDNLAAVNTGKVIRFPRQPKMNDE